MKKNIFLFICISLLSCNCIFSQTLHAIIFANTKSPGNPNKPGDTGIGPSVTVDFERMSLEMTSIASFIGYNLKKYYYYDTPDRFSRKSLLNVLNSLSCASEDIVFFYYSGHGGRYENEGSDYPEMVLKVPYGPASSDQLYALYDVYKTIMSKAPRLTIVLGDLCNSTMKGAYKESGAARGASVKSSSVCDVYKNLFLNVKGGLIATSSKPGHTSGCAKYNDGSDAGGVFTASFLECLGYYVSQGQEVSWDKLLQEIKKLSQQISPYDNYGEKQEPIFSTKDLVKAAAPHTASHPSSPIADDPQTSLKDDLASALTEIARDTNRPIERIQLISPTMSRFFSGSQARIQVVGKNCKTIVNTTTVSSYLNYLSIAVKMEQLIVLEEKKDTNGKVVYLKVHEMHRE